MAISSKHTKGIEIEIGGNATKLKVALDDANRSIKRTHSELDVLRNNLKLEWNADNFKRAQELAQRAVQQTTGKVDVLKKALSELDSKGAGKDTEQYEAIRRELSYAQVAAQKARQELDEMNKNARKAGRGVSDTSAAVETLATTLAAAGLQKAFSEITEAIQACVSASVDFESAMTGVFKTVDGTDTQLSAISDGIKQMSTEIPATTAEIAAVAEAAGQLGIATEDVLSFTRVMMDLGNSTDLSAEEAATALARFANIAGTSSQDYDRLGSVIVGLGNNFATTESEITAMATRLASAGTLAGLTEPEIMALAASMSSVGIEAEAGGTAMTQTLTAMEKAVRSGGEELEAFARIAGMSAEQFSAEWETNAVAAIQAFISGLGKLDEQGESATVVLDELGLSGVRQSNMLKSLALASDTLSGAVSMANQAWEQNTALTEEANKRYATTESKLAMMQNAFDNLKVAVGDVLSPALRDAADAGTEAFTWAADLIEQHPEIVSALSAVTAAIGTLTAVVSGTVVVLKVLKPLVETLKETLKDSILATPAGMTALAITTLTAAIVAFVATLPKASDEVRDLTDSLEESKKAFEETADSIQKGADDTLSMVTALENLMAVEVKSTAQKQAMADLVDQLNQSVPELNLAYDAQTDSLNLTAEAIRNVAKARAEEQLREAEIQRLSDLYVEQAQISTDLAAAQYRLTEAQADLNVMTEAGTYGSMGYEAETAAAEQAVISAKIAVSELTAAQSENQDAVEALEGKYQQAEQAVESAGDQAESTSGKFQDLTISTEDLSGRTKELAGAQDTLTDALQEQQKSGSLSLDTTLSMIDAGYAAAISIDQETGSVTLNTAAYIEIAKAKLDAQIATISGQQASVDAALAMKDEALMATDLGRAYLSAADAKNALEGQSKSYAAQKAALESLKDSLSNYSFASAIAARTTASSSKSIRTQAEKDLATYKELKSTLDHEKAMDEVSEREYYQQLKEYRDRYLTDKDNLDEYRKITEQIYSYDKSLVDAEAALWEEQTGTLISELEGRVKAVLDQQSRMEQSLSGYGSLFTIENDKMSLENIQDQIDAINAYEEALTGLKDRGISDSLMGEVLGMNVDEATQYAQQLISMTEDQWDKYNGLWEEKQRRAVEVAEKFYKDQLDTLKTEYDDKLGEALGELTDTAYTSGVDTAQGLIDGLAAKESALYAKAKTMADEVSRILSEAYAASGDVDGSHAAGLPYVPYDGYIAELHQGERVLTAAEAKAYIARSVPSTYDLPKDDHTQQMFGNMLSQAVNAMGTLATDANTVPKSATIIIQTEDKQTIARAFLPDLRAVMKSNPEAVNDY